jgi:hypothetical protein
MTREELIRECRNKQAVINHLNALEDSALALLRELNDALLPIPDALQARLDAVLDRAEEKS